MLFALASMAFGADWLVIAGTEEGRDDKPVKLFGFVQPQIEGIVRGDLVDGERPLFNTVNGAGPWSFLMRRARLAARGSIPGTDQRVTYFMMSEFGEVSITRGSPVMITDMTATLSYVPGVRFRIGQGKLPVMEEVVQGVAASLEFIHFSQTLRGLLLENPIEDGQYAGSSYGFRDIGVQAFDGFQSGHVAGSYAVMLSNGGGLHSVDLDAQKDLTVRGEIGWVPEGEKITSGRRKEVKVGLWWQEGSREWEDERHRRMRRGAYVHAEQGKVWTLVEVAQGSGMLEAGRAPPFDGGSIVMAPEGQGWGGVLSTGYRVKLSDVYKFGVKARYDQYHRRTEEAAAHRVFRTGTLGVELNDAKHLRLQLNYELRDLAAPDGSDAAQEIAAAMGDRVSFQVTARF